jgi:hypothetical protein
MNRRVRRSTGIRKRWYRQQHRDRAMERSFRYAVACGLVDNTPEEKARLYRMRAEADALTAAYRAARRP